MRLVPTVLCNPCDKVVEVRGHSTLYRFTRQPWFSVLHVVCPLCGNEQDEFFGEHWPDTLQTLDFSRVRTVVEEYAPEEIIWAYGEVYGINYFPNDLDESQEKQVAFFRYLLDQGAS